MPPKKRNTASTSASRKKSMAKDDAPSLTSRQLKERTVTFRIGGQAVPPEQGRDAMRRALAGKSRVNIHLDNDIIEFFKQCAGGRGYQTLINSMLRTLIEGQTLG